MTLRQLELFVAVAETGSFSRAAERVRLTQSTVSQHIISLEAEVGTQLLDRDRNGAQLTSGGEVFLQHARRVLAERDLLQQALAAFNGLEAARLTIGASNIPANYLIPDVLCRLGELYPGIALTMQSGDSGEILAKLVAAEIELAVVGSRSADPQIHFTPLARDLLVLVVGPQHPWWQRQVISLAELQSGRFVVREAGSGSELALQNELQRVGLDRQKLSVAARLGSNEAVCRTVAAGFGCAFVSERSIRRELAAAELCQVEVTGMKVERQFWLATLSGRSASPAASAVVELLLKTYAEQPD
ncbi:MAG TPA: selenium metabolism-associated LysR family transcriptional regulator [Malonomonas sp.]